MKMMEVYKWRRKFEIWWLGGCHAIKQDLKKLNFLKRGNEPNEFRAEYRDGKSRVLTEKAERVLKRMKRLSSYELSQPLPMAPIPHGPYPDHPNTKYRILHHMFFAKACGKEFKRTTIPIKKKCEMSKLAREIHKRDEEQLSKDVKTKEQLKAYLARVLKARNNIQAASPQQILAAIGHIPKISGKYNETHSFIFLKTTLDKNLDALYGIRDKAKQDSDVLLLEQIDIWMQILLNQYRLISTSMACPLKNVCPAYKYLLDVETRVLNREVDRDQRLKNNFRNRNKRLQKQAGYSDVLKIIETQRSHQSGDRKSVV